ncbi:AcrR family transcriptional regulator [Paenibacillus sp. DS2015]|uniref:TetR/AcrR family transcriptional regulator n=1 Tax=Paenibacillus sp. DS2015 TaxID=3373917 RepID=UPI003D25D810
MSQKTTDKKNHILKAALQLFSTKGISSTSMQEIAEVCGMSKGSLYLHFKSKEELEKSIYLYCIHMISNSIMQVELETQLSPKEQLQQQFETLLSHMLELREFVKHQLMDGANPPKNEMSGCIFEDQFTTIDWFKTKLETIYGPELKPYTLDLILMVSGMLISYIRIMFIPEYLPLNIRNMSNQLIFLLDHVADSMLTNHYEPLIPSDILSHWFNTDRKQASIQRHPLLISKEMRFVLKEKLCEGDQLTDALESIHILETELVNNQPRRAILMGMLANLEQIPEVEDMKKELLEIVKLYFIGQSDRSL